MPCCGYKSGFTLRGGIGYQISIVLARSRLSAHRAALRFCDHCFCFSSILLAELWLVSCWLYICLVEQCLFYFCFTGISSPNNMSGYSFQNKIEQHKGKKKTSWRFFVFFCFVFFCPTPPPPQTSLCCRQRNQFFARSKLSWLTTPINWFSWSKYLIWLLSNA